jgi:hypothetical protein
MCYSCRPLAQITVLGSARARLRRPRRKPSPSKTALRGLERSRQLARARAVPGLYAMNTLCETLHVQQIDLGTFNSRLESRSLGPPES